jgi:hypothetical protein
MRILLDKDIKIDIINMFKETYTEDKMAIGLVGGYIKNHTAIVKKMYLPQQTNYECATTCVSNNFVETYAQMKKDKIHFLGFALWVPTKYKIHVAKFSHQLNQCADYIRFSINSHGIINYNTPIEVKK